MPYRILYHRSARAELDECFRTYSGMRAPLASWLDDLAAEAQRREERQSWDIQALSPTMLASVGLDESSFQSTRDHLLRAPWLDALKALIEMVRTRKPPWEVRAAWRVFYVLDTFPCMPVVFFDVDHPGKRIIIRLFDGLPGR